MVTGASRGVGRGVAIGLASAGFEVFATGRGVDAADLPPSVVRIPCDHSHDEETAKAFAQVASDAGRLDVLVNSVWAATSA
jgi:dehydrogenase/reductase SDR family member 1